MAILANALNFLSTDFFIKKERPDSTAPCEITITVNSKGILEPIPKKTGQRTTVLLEMASGISTPKKIAADMGQKERAIKIPKTKPPNMPNFASPWRKCEEILMVYCLGSRMPERIMPTMIRMGPKSCLI